MSKHKKYIIGKEDKADFPLFELNNVNVKIDSGAYTSTIHCTKIRKLNNKLKVIFLDKNEAGYTGKAILFEQFTKKNVKSSNGEIQNRYIVKGTIKLFGEIFSTEFTLSKRSSMKYPVLLGRKLLSKHFLIDTSLSNESYKLIRQGKNENWNT